ncbi:MerR family transcriptional regulator [Paraflavisolibacter sp. H34]|uniref:MerR family transcriptional regulator n=1 Tax=Huijunlia imazamoxiresistens TaxID=3127457 RepID=UPI0030199EEF
MAKKIPSITFDFEDDPEPDDQAPAFQPTEFLSGNPVPPPPPKKEKSTRGRKSLKEPMPDQVMVPEDGVLFQKQYYSIGEVAGWFGVNTSLIRYWENEFDMVEPRKNRKGDRLFKPEDVKTLQLIYDLIRRRKFTLEGAKEYLKRNQQAEERYELIHSLQRIKDFLLELKAGL